MALLMAFVFIIESVNESLGEASVEERVPSLLITVNDSGLRAGLMDERRKDSGGRKWTAAED